MSNLRIRNLYSLVFTVALAIPLSILYLYVFGGQFQQTSANGGTDDGSHFRYGTLGWSPTGNPREVEFRLRAAFRLSAYRGRCIPAPGGGCPGGLPTVGDTIVEGQGPTGFAFGDGTIATGPNGTTLRFRVTSVDTGDPNQNARWLIGEGVGQSPPERCTTLAT